MSHALRAGEKSSECDIKYKHVKKKVPVAKNTHPGSETPFFRRLEAILGAKVVINAR